MHGAFTAAVEGVTYACREERRADQSAQGESIQNAANPRVVVPSRNLFSLIYHHGKLYHARLILTIVFLVSGHQRESRAGHFDYHDELAVFGMDPGLSQCPV